MDINIKLNEQQEAAEKKIIEWFNKKDNEKPIFILSGYAGTGKTFLINYLVENSLNISKEEIAFVAPTGKAATILIKKGMNASTIHKLIYDVHDEIVEQKVGENTIKVKKIVFSKKSSLPNYKLIILDEVSMVEDKMMKDLLSFNIKVLACGDLAQLPPVFGENSYIQNPDYTLTQIVRQSSESQIVLLADSIRKGGKLAKGNYGNQVFVKDVNEISKDVYDKLLLQADQIIVGSNNTKNEINKYIKQLKNFNTTKPNNGEKVIITYNNWAEYADSAQMYPLVNGMVGYIDNISLFDGSIGKCNFSVDFLENESTQIFFDSGYFKYNTYAYEPKQSILTVDQNYLVSLSTELKNSLNNIFNKKEIQALSLKNQKASTELNILNHIEPAYAISCHKCQGSEWENIVLFDESYIFRQNANKWLYTAITRAKRKLVIIQNGRK